MPRPSRFLAIGALVLGLASCGEGAVPAVDVDTSKIDFAWASPGVLSITGRPGAVRPGATAVTLTVQNPFASPIPTSGAGYRLQHLGGHIPVSSGFAAVEPDGGWKAVTQGSADRPVLPGFELDVTPTKGIVQVGYKATVVIP